MSTFAFRLSDFSRSYLPLDLFGTARPRAEDSAADLLRLAESYEATQPGFASDLRAAAASLSRTQA